MADRSDGRFGRRRHALMSVGSKDRGVAPGPPENGAVDAEEELPQALRDRPEALERARPVISSEHHDCPGNDDQRPAHRARATSPAAARAVSATVSAATATGLADAPVATTAATADHNRAILTRRLPGRERSTRRWNPLQARHRGNHQKSRRLYDSGAVGVDARGGHEETIRGFGLGDEDVAAWRRAA